MYGFQENKKKRAAQSSFHSKKRKKKKKRVKLGSSFQSPAKSMAYYIHIKKWDFISQAIYISFFLGNQTQLEAQMKTILTSNIHQTVVYFVICNFYGPMDK
jgi:hypothetical protein